MTKSQWIDRAAKESGMTKKQMEQAYDALFATLEDTLAAGEAVQITGFGSFNVRTSAARMGRNPKTNEAIQIPASRRVVFLPGKKLKDKVNEA